MAGKEAHLPAGQVPALKPHRQHVSMFVNTGAELQLLTPPPLLTRQKLYFLSERLIIISADVSSEMKLIVFDSRSRNN